VKFTTAARQVVGKSSPLIAVAFVIGWLRHEVIGEIAGSIIMISVMVVTYWLIRGPMARLHHRRRR